ncbi:recombinase family protein, partial [Vibrio harveyi]
MTQRQIYSYQRFSSPEQARGGSIQRQDDYAKRVAKEYGLTLNEDLIITDRGLSAFHAQHKESGAYGAFLEAVKQKRVATGSILIVENFDRLSRENARKAQRDIDDLIDNGITIITAHDNQLYNTESIAKNPYQIFVMVATMIRAHEESLTKQKRSVSFIHQQVKRFNKEGIADIAGAVPFWLDRLADKQGFVFNKHQSTMQLIIDRFLSGTGLMTISRELAELGIKSPSGNDRWGVTTIGSVLDNTALYGRKKFKLTYLKDGIEVVEDHDLQDYYPALISKDEFEQIKLKRKKRKGSRESYGEVVQLLTGYGKGRTVCGVCGYGLGSQTQKQKNRAGAYTKTVRRLHCLRHKERGDCCSSIIQDNLEATVIDQLEVFVDLSLLSGKVTDEAV